MKAYTIKPLEWAGQGEINMDFEAQTLVGEICVYADCKAGRNRPAEYWCVRWRTESKPVADKIPTLAAAKQAAWDAYVARVEQALEVYHG